MIRVKKNLFNVGEVRMRFISIASLFFFTHLAFAEPLYTSRDFQHDVKAHAKIIFYFVSAGMPLSMPGLKNTLTVAKAMGYKVQPLNDPVEPVTGENIPVALPASYTAAAGVPLHFPIILIYKNGNACGPAIPGYKNVKGYEQIIALYDQQCGKLWKNTNTQSHLTVSNIAKQIMETPIPRDNIAYYFKIIDNDWVTYHNYDQVYFFNRNTGTEFIAPGQFDGVATPDAQLFTIPAPLRFFSLAKIWADPNNAAKLQPDFLDNSMQDEYQSLGIVNDAANTRTYRAVTAWSANVAFRDYSYNKETGEITPGNPAKTICKASSISLPMLSKNGMMLGGHANAEAFTKIVSIGATGSECTLVQDFGFKTSKVAFNHDGNQVSFVTKDGDAINAYVYQLQTKSLTLLMTVSESKQEYLVFPDFLPNGNVLIMKVQRINGSVHSTLYEMELPI